MGDRACHSNTNIVWNLSSFIPSGLCGNYNLAVSDDLKTPQGIVEGTATSFSNTWKSNLMCRDTRERLDDPCSLSVENGTRQIRLALCVCLSSL